MFAVAGMLSVTSCTHEELDAVQDSEMAQVTFSLGVENAVGTKTISDGAKADKLVYAVYKLNAENTPVLQNVVGSNELGQFVKTDFTSGYNVSLTLAKGQTYQVAFWAQDGDCKAYNTDKLTNVQVSYKAENGTDDAANNDELRDAFFKMVEFKVAGNKTIDVVMERPFAQVNVGVTNADWNAAVASGIRINESSVVIAKAANTINLLTGEATGEETVTYTLDAIPTETLYVDTDNDGTKEEYKWLSMNYVLVPSGKSTFESLKFTFSPVSGNDIIFSEGLNSVPVQRNWRTNILGKILTGDIKFNITIDPVYDGEVNYPKNEEYKQQLEFAATFGGTVNMNSDVILSEPLNVAADMILNMNGKTLSGNINLAEGASLTIENGTIQNTNKEVSGITTNGDLTLNNVEITSARHALRIESGNVVINGGTYKVEPASGTGMTMHALNVGDNGTVAKVTIKGGTFIGPKGTNADSGSAIKIYSGSSVTIEGGNFSGGKNETISNKGTMVITGGTYDQQPNSDWVANGYKVVESNSTYYVVANEIGAVVSSNEEFATALKIGGMIILNEGEYTFPAGNVFEGEVKVVAAEGANVIVNLPKSTYIPGTKLTLEGLTFSTPAGLTYTESAFGFIHHAAEFNMNNCIIEGGRLRLNVSEANIDKCQFNVTASSGFDGYGLFYYGNNGSTVNVSNCTFTALQKAIVLYNESAITMNLNVDNCTFTASQTTDKAAISIHSELGINGTVNITNSTATGFADHNGGLWRDVNNNTGINNKNFTVTVDGKLVAIKGFGTITDGYYKIGNTYTVLSGQGFHKIATTVLTEASNNVIIELANDINLSDIEWPAVCTKAEFVLDGKGHIIKNLTTSAVEDHGFYSTAMFTSTRKKTTIKNVIIENATVTGNGRDNSHGAVLVACNYNSLNISGVTVKNSTVSNCDRSSVITTYLYFTDATVENCVVEGCTVNSIGTAGAILGMNNSHNFIATGNTVTSTTISSSEGGNKAGILIGTWQTAGTLTDEANVVENSKAINAGTETNNKIGRTV